MRIASDPTRRLLLDGAGLVERPLEVTPELTGFPAPTVRAYTYRAGQVIDGEAEADEMVMLLLRGDIELAADGLEHHGVRADPFTAAPVVLYLPPGGRYRATVRADSHVLYCRAWAAGRRRARIGEPGEEEVISPAVAEQLRVREHRAEPGAWASLPLAPGSCSVVYHRFTVPEGWALHPERERAGVPDGAIVVRDGDALVSTGAVHELAVGPDAGLLAVTVTAAPG